VDFIGGYSALVQKGMTKADRALIASLRRRWPKTISVRVGQRGDDPRRHWTWTRSGYAARR
jgi:hypothetical protein